MKKNFAERARAIEATYGRGSGTTNKLLKQLYAEQQKFAKGGDLNMENEIKRGIQVELEHAGSLKEIEEKGKMPTAEQFARLIATDHIKDFKKEHDSGSYYKSLIEGDLSDEAKTYALGGSIAPTKVTNAQLESLRQYMAGGHLMSAGTPMDSTNRYATEELYADGGTIKTNIIRPVDITGKAPTRSEVEERHGSAGLSGRKEDIDAWIRYKQSQKAPAGGNPVTPRQATPERSFTFGGTVPVNTGGIYGAGLNIYEGGGAIHSTPAKVYDRRMYDVFGGDPSTVKNASGTVIAGTAPANTGVVVGGGDYMGLIKQYFPETEWQNAYRVMMGESGGNPNAWRKEKDNPGGGEDMGLFQINSKYHPDIHAGGKVFDPEYNIKSAAGLWAKQGWGPWVAAKKLGIKAEGGNLYGEGDQLSLTTDKPGEWSTQGILDKVYAKLPASAQGINQAIGTTMGGITPWGAVEMAASFPGAAWDYISGNADPETGGLGLAGGPMGTRIATGAKYAENAIAHNAQKGKQAYGRMFGKSGQIAREANPTVGAGAGIPQRPNTLPYLQGKTAPSAAAQDLSYVKAEAPNSYAGLNHGVMGQLPSEGVKVGSITRGAPKSTIAGVDGKSSMWPYAAIAGAFGAGMLGLGDKTPSVTGGSTALSQDMIPNMNRSTEDNPNLWDGRTPPNAAPAWNGGGTQPELLPLNGYIGDQNQYAGENRTVAFNNKQAPFFTPNNKFQDASSGWNKQIGRTMGNMQGDGSGFNTAARMAPVAFNALSGLLTKQGRGLPTNVNLQGITPQVIAPEQMSTAPVEQQIGQQYASGVNALSGTGNSAAAIRAGLSGMSLAGAQGGGAALNDIYSRNAAIRGEATKFNALAAGDAAKFNAQQSNMSKQINLSNLEKNQADKAATDKERYNRFAAAATGIGQVGKENWSKDMLSKVYGYNEKGEHVSGDPKLNLNKAQLKLLRGGYLKFK